MRELTLEEVGQVSGGLDPDIALPAIVGLIALAPASVPVVAVGVGAIVAITFIREFVRAITLE